MRIPLVVLITAAVLLTAIPAFAELQTVQVGGSIRVRGNYWTSPAGPDSWTARNSIFQGPLTNSFRPAGNPLAGLRWAAQPGRLAVVSPVDWDETGHGVSFVEQRTKLNAKADFTDQVASFVELDSYDIWGEDFRSNYITGANGRAVSVDDVEVYQAYIEANEMWGQPLRLRIGRQELKFGSGWLIGTNDAGSFFRGLSFDGVRATYATDMLSVDAVWAKLAENGPIEEDGDVDLYGVYGSYLGIENITLDAYWLMLRDARSLADTQVGWFGEWVEDVLNVDDYDVTDLHTIGLRAAGVWQALDFEGELAYQFGDADAVGRRFAGAGLLSPYGDDEADYGEWGGNLLLGYTFDVQYSPRVFVGGAYFGGEDNRDLNFWQWLGAVACPFWHADASVSFNRLFSDWQYGQFVGSDNHDCSNLWVAYTGVNAKPTEKLTVALLLAYVQSLEDYDAPWPTFSILGRRFVPLGALSWLDRENADHLCTELCLSATYNYSQDLSFEVGYSHMFLGEGAAQGNFNLGNGLVFEGGTDDDDADYVYLDTKISF